MTVRLEPWTADAHPLLERLLGDPAMMTHLGGPESAEKIAERQARYQQPDSRQFKVVLDGTEEGVGWVGYWERTWQGAEIYEIGWSVVPEFQGQGIASSATARALELAAAEGTRRYVHAFPSVDNAPSNAICRKCGFVLLADYAFEYPPGSTLHCNDWTFDLSSLRGSMSGSTQRSRPRASRAGE